MKTATFTMTRTDTGAVLPYAKITVYQTDGLTKAPIFDATGRSIDNPAVADLNGAFTIAAGDGSYILSAVSADGGYSVPPVAVDLYDLPAIAAACQGYASLATGISAATNVLSAAAAALPYQVTAISGGLGTGTGGADGTYAGGVSGGPAGLQWTYTIAAGKLASYNIVNPGLATTNAAPTLSLPSGGMTGATVPTATVATIPVNRTFLAPSADGLQRLAWINSAGALASYPVGGTQYSEYLKAGVDVQSAKTDIYGSARPNPNLWPDSEFEYYLAGGSYLWGATSFNVISENGGLRIQNPATATEFSLAVSQYIPVASLPSGKLSISLVLSSKAASTLGDQTFRLYGRDAANALVTNTSMWGASDGYGNANDAAGTNTWARKIQAAAITKPTEIIICQSLDTAALIAAGVTNIELRLRTFTTAQIAFSHIAIRNGADPHWVPTRVSPKGVADVTAAAALSTARVNGRLSYGWAKNLIADPYLASAGATVGAPAWTSTMNVVSKWGMACVEIPANGSTASNKRNLTFVDLTSIPTGTPLSISVVIAEKIGTTDINTRLRLFAFDAASAAVNIGGSTIAGNDYTADTVGYSRAIPTGDITQPTTISIWEGVAKPAGVTRIAFDVRQQSNPAIYITGFLVRVGTDAAGTPPSSAAGGGAQVAYVSTTGSDSNTGTAASPFATLQAAITALGGRGTVFVAAGAYTATQRFDPATVTAKIRIVGARGTYPAYDGYPVIKVGTKLTGISKVGGYTKVYKASLTGLSVTNAAYAWIWQDGVADPRTAIADADRSPQHRGRANRLKDCAKIIKTAAATIATACTEIDAGAYPLGFVDDATGDFYFSIVGGGDATAANIYVDATTGLVNGPTGLSGREVCGELEIQGLEVRYGGITFVPFRRGHVDEVTVIGSRGNALDYSIFSYGTLEVAGAGALSSDTATGDGLNGHYGAKLVFGNDLYTHDNLDDGWSDHEGCSSRMIGGGLAEYNGGTALAPAYGSDHIARNFASRRNQQVSGRKVAAFAVVGVPAGSGAYADDGYDTLALWTNCVSIGDTRGFADGGTATSKAVAIGCKVYDLRGDDPTIPARNYGFDGNMELRDCGFSSSLGTAKPTSGTVPTVKNTTVVS